MIYIHVNRVAKWFAQNAWKLNMDEFVGGLVVGFVVGIIIGLIIGCAIYSGGRQFKDGQLEALNGRIYYHREEADGEIKWVESERVRVFNPIYKEMESNNGKIRVQNNEGR